MIKVWVQGYTGKLGILITELIKNSKEFKFIGGGHSGTTDEELRSGVSEADFVIDCSTVESNRKLFQVAEPQKIIILTTGLNVDTLQGWKIHGQKNVVIYAPNTSIGIFLMNKALESVLQNILKNPPPHDIQLTETHHKHKKDAPSGTAKFLENTLEDFSSKWTTTSIRGGGVFGEHEIRFLFDHEEFKISHRAFSRDLFAKGALQILKKSENLASGYYTVNDIYG